MLWVWVYVCCLRIYEMLKRLVKDIGKRFIVIDGYCKCCGATMDNPVFSVEDEVWDWVCGADSGELCLRCFFRQVWAKGDNWADVTIHGWHGHN